MALRNTSKYWDDSDTSGKRMPALISPISCNTHFTGIGLASTNSFW